MIYLDYNASAPIALEVLNTVIEVMSSQMGNADSRTHEYGANSMAIVQSARKSVAGMFAVDPQQVIFTSGATESNNMVIQGLKDYGKQTNKKHIIISSVEHKSVLESAKALSKYGFEVETVYPDDSGRVKAEDLLERVRPDTLLVGLMHVNNETGIIQPVDQIGKFLKKRGVLFLVDATQSAGKLIDEIQKLDYDFLSFSAHKFQGPQGIGGLIINSDVRLTPLMYGGHQERGYRPGTVPVALCAGLGKACSLALENHLKNQNQLKELKTTVLKVIEDSKVKYSINGDPDYCVDSMINISFDDVSSEALMVLLKGICAVSNGSACTSNEYSLSYVLKSMGLPENQIEEALRISWGPDTDENELKKAVADICQIVLGFQ
ncbi:cysteine desulfurase family protein [Ileibacterium valens]|uniref:cysteine desulfurase family protein n=1 Tax=Ileibacterium valens TaxID=1862668 RepID=UPI00272B1A25|nr:cysteine desulfurase family protein [Ileibacterium valens]